jgi:hypothetical protein
VGHPLATRALADLVERIGRDGAEVITVQHAVKDKIKQPLARGAYA